MQRLKKLLENGLNNAQQKGLDLNLPEHARMLNMACGRADETQVISDLLLSKTDSAEILGIDLRHREIEMAKAHWKDQLPALVKTQFLNLDATKLNEHESLQEKNDLALFRHQNYWNDRKIWRSIFENTIDTDQEHELAIKELTEQGLELVTNLHNEQSRTVLKRINKSVDRHLAIFRKP